MQTVVIVELDTLIADTVSTRIRHTLNVDTVVTTTYEEAKLTVNQLTDKLLAVIISLPFCKTSYSPFENVPTIVITDGVPLESKMMFSATSVLDYVIDYRGHNFEYIIQLLKRVRFAETIKVLVVDDERANRKLVGTLLANRGFSVEEATNGIEAITCIEADPNISMVLVDDQMPRMNGFELVGNIRKLRSKNELAIIGMLSDDSEYRLVMFLRSGANDCLVKPFKLEEFQVRVMQNLQLLEMFKEITELSRRDFLTNLFNRRHFFEVGKKFYENYRRNALKFVTAMIDIDNFKSINDTYGHSTGDRVLVVLSETLISSLRATDIVARFGGEEFCILSNDLVLGEGILVFERIRKKCADISLDTPKGPLSFTISIGLTGSIGESFDDMINTADKLLYKAKNSGKNKVVAQ